VTPQSAAGGSSNVFFHSLPSSLSLGLVIFVMWNPLHNQAEKPLPPEVIALYIDTHLRCLAESLLRFPVIVASPCRGTPINIHAVIVSVLGRDQGIKCEAFFS